MYRIRIHGRGGQGIKMASHVLGTALFHCGYCVQDAPKYGAERRGAPLFATVRAVRDAGQNSVIGERGVINNPDLVVVADDTLLTVPTAGTLQGLDQHSVLLISSHESAQTWQERLNLVATVLVLPVDEEVADRAEQPLIGATCVGAAACLLGMIGLDTLEAALKEELRELGSNVIALNCDRAMAAFFAMATHKGMVIEGSASEAAGYTPPKWIELPRDSVSRAAPAIHAAANSVQVHTGLWRTMRPEVNYEHCKKCWWICSTLCPDSAISVENNSPVIDYDHCKGCLICASVCPPHAIEMLPEHQAQQREANHE